MNTKLVAFDMDGVLTDYLNSWGWIDKHFGVDSKPHRVLLMEQKIDNAEFIRRNVALWRSKQGIITIKELERITATIPPMKGIKEAIDALNEHGIKSAIISAGSDIAASRIMRENGITYCFANGLAANANGELTGEAVYNVDIWNKAATLKALMKKTGVKKSETAAVGDTRSDVSMFNAAGLGIAFNPYDDVVKKEADCVIVEKDLTNVLKYILD